MGWCPYLKMYYTFLTSSALVNGVYFCLCLDDVEKNKYAHKPHHVIIVCRGGISVRALIAFHLGLFQTIFYSLRDTPPARFFRF